MVVDGEPGAQTLYGGVPDELAVHAQGAAVSAEVTHRDGRNGGPRP
jgi:hypothetical protein